MKGRHVVILVFVFGLTLMAILFKLLPGARVAAPAVNSAPPPEEPAPPPPAPDPVTAGSIEVYVRSRETAIQGATVTFQFQDLPPFQLRSGAEGRCYVPRAEPGPWQIVARAAGVAAASTSITVETGRTARAELSLIAAVRIEGFVRDGAGVPVAGARVSMSLPDPTFTARTDALGRFVIQGVPTGTHALTASSERLRPHTRPQIDMSVPGQTYTLDFMLAFGTTLSGIVVDEAGRPVSKASVTVVNEVARVVKTDGNGEFRVDGLGDSPVTVSVSARGFAPARHRGIVPGGPPLLTIRLSKGASVRGRLDAPPPHFLVHLRSFDDLLGRWMLVSSKTFTGADSGAFQISELAAGRYEAVVESTDRRTPAPIEFSLLEGETYDLGLVVLASK